MNTLKILLLGLVTVLILYVFIKNINSWAKIFREYMLRQAYVVFRNGNGWEKPWAAVFSKIIIIFFGAMLIVGFFAFLFGPVYI